MSALSLRLPESIHQKLGELAVKEGVSINQLISSAVAEKVSALLTEEYLAERARRGNRARFAAVLAKVPDVPPVQGDELPEGIRTARRPANPPLQRTGRKPTRR